MGHRIQQVGLDRPAVLLESSEIFGRILPSKGEAKVPVSSSEQGPTGDSTTIFLVGGLLKWKDVESSYFSEYLF